MLEPQSPKNTLTKARLTEIVAQETHLERSHALAMVEQFFSLVKSELLLGKEIKISGFGNFFIRAKRSRPGRNPRTGEYVEIKARQVVVFKPSTLLKAALNKTHLE